MHGGATFQAQRLRHVQLASKCDRHTQHSELASMSNMIGDTMSKNLLEGTCRSLDNAGSINLNGHTLYVDGKAYTAQPAMLG